MENGAVRVLRDDRSLDFRTHHENRGRRRSGRWPAPLVYRLPSAASLYVPLPTLAIVAWTPSSCRPLSRGLLGRVVVVGEADDADGGRWSG